MKVSFGKIYMVNERANTTAPVYIKNAILKSYEEETGKYSPYYQNLEEYLEETKNADIFVKTKKDGTVDIEIRKDAYDPDGEFGEKFMGFVPYDVKEKEKLQLNGLKIDTSLPKNEVRKAIKKLEKQISNFAKKCEKYAKQPNNTTNIKLAEANEIRWEKHLMKIDDSILKQIEDMGNFRFGN